MVQHRMVRAPPANMRWTPSRSSGGGAVGLWHTEAEDSQWPLASSSGSIRGPARTSNRRPTLQPLVHPRPAAQALSARLPREDDRAPASLLRTLSRNGLSPRTVGSYVSCSLTPHKLVRWSRYSSQPVDPTQVFAMQIEGSWDCPSTTTQETLRGRKYIGCK